MQALPSGTVTFVFTDIEGSTELLKQLGNGYGEVLATHRRIVRETFAAANGIEIDTQGDAFFFAFPRARDAVATAVEAQRAHAASEWPEGSAVRVRMGLHTGEPSVVEEGYLAPGRGRSAGAVCSSRRTCPAEHAKFECFGTDLAAGIQERVLGSLERSLGKHAAPSSASSTEDADVEGLAERSSALEEQIRARVEAALEAKGISRDES